MRLAGSVIAEISSQRLKPRFLYARAAKEGRAAYVMSNFAVACLSLMVVPVVQYSANGGVTFLCQCGR